MSLKTILNEERLKKYWYKRNKEQVENTIAWLSEHIGEIPNHIQVPEYLKNSLNVYTMLQFKFLVYSVHARFGFKDMNWGRFNIDWYVYFSIPHVGTYVGDIRKEFTSANLRIKYKPLPEAKR